MDIEIRFNLGILYSLAMCIAFSCIKHCNYTGWSWIGCGKDYLHHRLRSEQVSTGYKFMAQPVSAFGGNRLLTIGLCYLRIASFRGQHFPLNGTLSSVNLKATCHLTGCMVTVRSQELEERCIYIICLVYPMATHAHIGKQCIGQEINEI